RRPGSGPSLGRLREWQQHRHRRAARLAILDRHAAVMLVDDLLHNGKSKSSAAWFSRHVRLENPRHQLLGEAAAVVRDGEAHAVARQLGAYLNRGRTTA